jgi:predicted AAA+ superfamily ATPase
MNWTFAESEGALWENFIAGHLLKNVQAWTDCAFGEFELYYIRDKQKREVDFFITRDGKPYLLLEVKSNQSTPTNALIHYNEILKPKFCIQLVKEKAREKRKILAHPSIQIMEASRFLLALN